LRPLYGSGKRRRPVRRLGADDRAAAGRAFLPAQDADGSAARRGGRRAHDRDGPAGARARTKKGRNVLFGISCYFFIVVFALVFSMRPPLGAAVFLFVVFLVYPIVWMLHETHKIRYPVYTTAVAGLDVFSKIGLGFILAV
jgi:hypothetical protein